jgi:ABC-type branched-subunit amino acid transport system substrate-binding protein
LLWLAPAVAGLLAAGCSSSSHSTASSGSGTTASTSASGGTTGATAASGGTGTATGSAYTVGVITDETGPLAIERAQDVQSANAAVKWINAHGGVNGHPLKIVVADEQSSPTGAASAAQVLVSEKHVLGITSDSNFIDAMEPFLYNNHVAIAGLATGASWLNPQYTNQFPLGSNPGGGINTPINTVPLFAKQHGGTKWAVLGQAGLGATYDTLLKQEGNIGTAVGMKTVLVDNSIPLQNPNYTAVALQVKNTGADAVYILGNSQTDSGILAALHNEGATIKVGIAATWNQGYVNSANQAALQNSYITEPFTPWSVSNSGTTTMKAAFAQYAPSVQPAENPYYQYTGILTLAAGLKAAGANPTSASLISGLQSLTNWDADGLWASQISFVADFQKNPSTCTWFLVVQGTNINAATSAPFCGQTVPLSVANG